MKRTSQTKCTVTRDLYNYIKSLLVNNNLATVHKKVFEHLYNKQVTELKNAYCSTEWYISQRLTRAVMYDYKYLRIV